ncbi:hypothetical protein fHeYen901_15 [Yersinia phage fHe-Yen9-01]|uniref:Uncharacterized protein n=1 Tax=Yersinia phage fHe-Yen9-01 TaxID=1965363 RepID=A0A1V0DXB3_9CAUD|nr:hypothetical protein KNT60_gp014 [Yersinia phage fHe-Yen9-01]ARB05788.1 hypothetical protein fHeYen901_15 [Yersinia phage fHe-Yen9-01]
MNHYDITDQTEITVGTRLVFKSRIMRDRFANLYEINDSIACFSMREVCIEVSQYDTINRKVTGIKGFNNNSTISKISFHELKTYFNIVTDCRVITHTEQSVNDKFNATVETVERIVKERKIRVKDIDLTKENYKEFISFIELAFKD